MSKQLPTLLCLLALLVTIPAFAQKDKTKKSKKEQKEEEIYNLVAQETCDCMAGKDVMTMAPENIEMNLGICMLGSFSTHSDKLGQDPNFGNSNDMEALGEKIGLLMFTKCPDILMAVATRMSGDVDMGLEDIPDTANEEMYWDGGEELSGSILRMSDKDDVRYVTIKDEEGAEHELMWLRYFEGSEALLEDTKSGVGRKVTIYWVPMECYSAKEKDYRIRKEIRSIAFDE